MKSRDFNMHDWHGYMFHEVAIMVFSECPYAVRLACDKATFRGFWSAYNEKAEYGVAGGMMALKVKVGGSRPVIIYCDPALKDGALRLESEFPEGPAA